MIPPGTTTDTYDPLARLASFTRGGTTTTYGWQATSNRSSVQTGAGTPVTSTFDDANRLTADSAGGTYTADADGRMTARPGYRYEWDALGRLTKVKPPTGNSTIATYTYDPLDRLLVADYGGNNRTRFRYVGLTPVIAETVNDQNGSLIRAMGTDWTGEHQEDWTGTGSNVRFYGTDAHHDLTWTADSTGAVAATLRYDPWGTLTSSTGSSLPDLRFQGSWSDTTTDLSWVVSRWYAPTLGTFISEDSLAGDPADPPSRHLYAYAEGNPIAGWDPLGTTTVKTYSLQNRAHFKGTLVLSLFIARAENTFSLGPIPVFTFVGDNRSWSPWMPATTRSRGVFKFEFNSAPSLTVTIHDSCGHYPVGPTFCASQFPIVDHQSTTTVCSIGMMYGTCQAVLNERVNIVKLSESSDGSIGVTWDITQAIQPVMRPDLTVNGSLSIRPGSWYRDDAPRISYRGDGFPSEEMYWFDRCTRTGCLTRRTVFQHREGPFEWMKRGDGDWSGTYKLPQA